MTDNPHFAAVASWADAADMLTFRPRKPRQTAGFRLEYGGHVLLIDPYLTRASLARCVTRPLRSDLALLGRHVPRADAIVAGHTHFDHVLDVPSIALSTGAAVYGSKSCATLCLGAGVPAAQVVDVEARGREPQRAEVGPFELHFIPSVHSSLFLGRIPFPGDISDCDQVPLRAHRYRCGAVFSVDIRVAGRRIYHLGSASLLDSEPEPEVDLLLLCVAGWTTTERFSTRVMSALEPDKVLLSHWDDFFAPLERGARLLPAMQMPRLVEQLIHEDRGVKVGTLPILGELRL